MKTQVVLILSLFFASYVQLQVQETLMQDGTKDFETPVNTLDDLNTDFDEPNNAEHLDENKGEDDNTLEEEEEKDEGEDLSKRGCNGGKILPRSCRDIKRKYPKAVSGVYVIRPGIAIGLIGPHVHVYCEMAINGGGYTFLPRRHIRKNQNLVKHLFKDNKSVLLRFQKPDGTQPYTIIQQRHDKSRIPLSVKQNSHAGYTAPRNLHLGAYIFLGILPANNARQRNTQGFRSNGRDISFHNCDANPNSLFAFFPNHEEKPPSKYHPNPVYEKRGVAVEWRKTGKRMPSSRVMARRFFLFTEMHFGGCGCYTSSNRWLRRDSTQPALDTAIGVR